MSTLLLNPQECQALEMQLVWLMNWSFYFINFSRNRHSCHRLGNQPVSFWGLGWFCTLFQGDLTCILILPDRLEVGMPRLLLTIVQCLTRVRDSLGVRHHPESSAHSILFQLPQLSYAIDTIVQVNLQLRKTRTSDSCLNKKLNKNNLHNAPILAHKPKLNVLPKSMAI